MDKSDISLFFRENNEIHFIDLEINQSAIQGFNETYQRIIDVFIAMLGLIIAIPLIAFFGIAILIETPGPVIYSQERLGKGGRIFTIYKLRSMNIDAEKNGAQWAKKNDPRITKVGAFIRRTRIDELPQIFNVLRGEMSIVGPRPERPNFTIEFNRKIPGFINRLQVRPGITGWAQVNGGYDMTPKQKWQADMYYIENRNLAMDFKIIMKTIKIVFSGYGAR